MSRVTRPWSFFLAALLTTGCGAKPRPALAPEVALAPCAAEPPGQPDTALVTRFYRGLDHGDVHAMACTYHPQVEFWDPMFGTLRGKRALAMWAMLVQLSEGKLRVQASKVRADPRTHLGSAHWNARYTFSFLGRANPVRNSVDATFLFKDGKIFRHGDAFDLDRWMQQALWPLGGVVPKGTIKSVTKSLLDDFVKEHPAFR